MKKTVPRKTTITRPYWVQSRPLTQKGLDNWSQITWEEPEKRTYRVKINGRWVDGKS
ncbi:MAG TPA: hypothetical protein VMT56_00235 [Candidatus Bathyarchaeia archaeon]|nr:hypothetical protein [Candidatus Bathyarchaeia archaeon]